MVRANPIILFRKQREYFLILETILCDNPGITYKEVGKRLNKYNIEYLRDKIKLLVEDGLVKEKGDYNRILIIPKSKCEIIKNSIELNKKMIDICNNGKIESCAENREKDRKRNGKK